MTTLKLICGSIGLLISLSFLGNTIRILCEEGYFYRGVPLPPLLLIAFAISASVTWWLLRTGLNPDSRPFDGWWPISDWTSRRKKVVASLFVAFVLLNLTAACFWPSEARLRQRLGGNWTSAEGRVTGTLEFTPKAVTILYRVGPALSIQSTGYRVDPWKRTVDVSGWFRGVLKSDGKLHIHWEPQSGSNWEVAAQQSVFTRSEQ